MTEQEQKAFTAMREALENIAGDKWPDPEITAEEYAREALTAANAVQPQAQEPACGTCGNTYLAVRTDVHKDKREFMYCDCCGAMADRKTWNRAHPQATEPAEKEDPLQGAVDWLLQADGEFFAVATVQRTLRIGYNRAKRLADTARERAAAPEAHHGK